LLSATAGSSAAVVLFAPPIEPNSKLRQVENRSTKNARPAQAQSAN
jgi:hypothetical protein